MRTAEAVTEVADGALADDELVTLFAPFAGARHVALAVSGGADSLALLDGVDRWRRVPGRPPVIVLTVDHALRPDSARATATVKAIAEGRGLPVRVLTRVGPAPESDIEAAARAARYRLLFDACRAEGVTHLVVAHQRDDVAETFLMRLNRGAGVFGLAAMRPVLAAGDVTLVRPFLNVPRARLAATTAAAGWALVDDPMNRDPRFARTEARRLLADGDLDAELFAGLASRFADLAETIDAAASALIAHAVAVDQFAVAWLDAARFADAADEVRRRALVRLVLAVGGGEYSPRADRLSALLATMVGDGRGASLKRTLAGTVVERKSGRFAIYREAGRASLPTISADPGLVAAWDRRFVVSVEVGAPSGLTLGPLGEAGRREVGATAAMLESPVPAGALVALPALRRGAEILAVPVFREGGAPFGISFRPIVGERLARPPLFPDFGAG